MSVDLPLTAASFVIGVVVGLTGMGGGALMTPMLVLLFGVNPLTAVSSDLVASAVMKPVGAVAHLRLGTAHRPLVGWLCAGSVPAAFAGVLITRVLGDSPATQRAVQLALGVALLLAAAGLLARAHLRARARDAGGEPALTGAVVRPGWTVLVGAVGGLVVGTTSVGSGSLMMVALMLLYPSLTARQLVGTDLLQAVPLVASAALGHVLFGHVELAVATPILLGSLPGVWVGAHLSARAPEWLVRPVLAVVLVATGLRLLGASTWWAGAALGATLALAAGRRVATGRRPGVLAPPS